MHVCKTLSDPDQFGLQSCLIWAEFDPDYIYTLISAFAITPQQATYICVGYGSIQIFAHLLKQARRSVT